MRLLAAFERQIEFGYTESAIKKQFAVRQTGRRGAQAGSGGCEPKDREIRDGNRGEIRLFLLKNALDEGGEVQGWASRGWHGHGCFVGSMLGKEQ